MTSVVLPTAVQLVLAIMMGKVLPCYLSHMLRLGGYACSWIGPRHGISLLLLLLQVMLPLLPCHWGCGRAHKPSWMCGNSSSSSGGPAGVRLGEDLWQRLGDGSGEDVSGEEAR